MTFTLSLFERTTHSSSLSVEEIKLFNIANWIFYVSYFLRLFIMSFKYGLILLRYSCTDIVLYCFITIGFMFNIIFTPWITYSYYFMIIFFFFFFKKNFNASNIFNYFSFFFDVKRFLISLITVYFSSFSWKRFLIPLIISSPFSLRILLRFILWKKKFFL